jgi:hypothetical protein
LILRTAVEDIAYKKQPRILLKLDISKADSVNWTFLLEVMERLGFGRIWRYYRWTAHNLLYPSPPEWSTGEFHQPSAGSAPRGSVVPHVVHNRDGHAEPLDHQSCRGGPSSAYIILNSSTACRHLLFLRHGFVATPPPPPPHSALATTRCCGITNTVASCGNPLYPHNA